MVGILGLCLIALVACESDDDQGDSAGGSGASSSGGTPGSSGGEGGSSGSVAGAGAISGAGGEAGSGVSCECENDDGEVTLSLECACGAGLCHDLEEGLEIVEAYEFGSPYYVRLGSCESGITALEWQEGTENGGASHFDDRGRMLHDSNGGYVTGFGLDGLRPYECPAVDFGGYSFGNRTELSGCTWCLVEADDSSKTEMGGGGGEPSYDDETGIPDCEFDEEGRPLPPAR